MGLTVLRALLLAAAAGGTAPGFFGFAAGVTGGAGGTRVSVDTLSWIGPGDRGFSTADCTDADSGDCSLAEALCASNRYVTFSVGGDITIPPNVSSSPSGAGSSIAFEWGRDCPGARVENVTLDGSTAPGAGVQIRGGSMRLAGSAALPTRNILVRHMRFRGTGDVQLGTFDIGGGVSDVMISNVSAAFGGAYGLSLSPVFSGEVNDPIRRITIQSSIVGLVHVYGQWARFGSSNVQGEFGGCSNAPSTRCCDASHCSGGGTCTKPPPGAHCWESGVDGVCFGGTRKGLACGDGTDRGCPGGLCSARCVGSGVHVGKRAGLDIANNFQAQADWVTDRNYSATNGGLCEGGTRDGLLCMPSQGNRNCPGGGTCRAECPLTTDYAKGPFLTYGAHALAVGTWGDTAQVSFYDVLFGPGNLYRQPQITVDAGVSGFPHQPRMPFEGPAQFEIVNSLAYGGLWMLTSWVQGPRRVEIAVIDSVHRVNSATRSNWKDLVGDTEAVHLWASHHASVGELGSCGVGPPGDCNVRHYFKGGRDRRRKNDSDPLCWAYSYQLPGGHNSYLIDGCEATEAERLENGYGGQREAFNAYPDWGGESAMVAALLSRVGATKPCRDAVDDLMIKTIEANEDLRVTWSPADVGGAQDLSKGCVSQQPNAPPTAQSKTVTVSAGSGISTWSANVSDADHKPLDLYCFVTSAGSARLAIHDRGNCEDGTVDGTLDVTGLGAGSYPGAYKVCDGRPADCRTGTITVMVR